jgi:hypothetical protein
MLKEQKQKEFLKSRVRNIDLEIRVRKYGRSRAEFGKDE